MSTTFKSRAEQETQRKRSSSSVIKIQDAERRKCSKLIVPEMRKLTGLIAALKEKTSSSSSLLLTVCHLQLKLSKELVLEACTMLGFIDQVSELEELAHDAPQELVALIDNLIDECQDGIIILDDDDDHARKWSPDAARDAKRTLLLDKVVERMGKVVGMVFKSKRQIKTEERFDILNLCCALFEAAQFLTTDAAETGEFEYDPELDDLFEDAVCKCDDQSMDEYLDCEEEEEDEEDDD